MNLADLELTNPVIAAPMSGGPSTPDLVLAAARAGSLGFLAGGYKTADELSAEIARVRTGTPAFGVNLFAPNPIPAETAEYRRYADAIRSEGERFGLDLAGAPMREDDDQWPDKIDLLLAEAVPVVSFTFGLPDPPVIKALQAAGSTVLQTVTSAHEAQLAADAGVDGFVTQGSGAGGHSGTLTPNRLPDPVPLTELVQRVRHAVSLPIVAAGGIGTPAQVTAVMEAGAIAAAVGTVLLQTEESGASGTYKAALEDSRDAETIVTRAFTGRPARGIPNLFTDRYDALAPAGYPAIHYLTAPLRRAAHAAGDTGLINIWAGTAHHLAGTGSATDVLLRLAEGIRPV